MRLKKSLLAAAAIVAPVALALGTAQANDLGPVKAMEVDEAKAALGKRLFFDPRLSGNAELSCSSCHNPETGFSDGQMLSDAYTGSLHFRNVPTVINAAQRAAWMHDGRLGTNLNDVTREMITETYLMNMDMRLMQERIKQDPVYVKMFKDAGYGEPSNGSVRKAIPEYLKTLTSRNAPFDKGELTVEEQRGYDLFVGQAGCVSCHNGPRFTDDQPYNIGVPNNPEIWNNPERHVTFVTYGKFMGVESYMNLREDLGAYVRDHREESKRKFLTPSLRELVYTAPYMHNGMFDTLEAVVDFYSAGGGDDVNKDPRIKPLNLTGEQKGALVAFLKTLSGDPLTGPEFVPEEIDTDYPVIENWREVKN
ncbi:cytochrome-c peroxidase [Rhodovibrionaceae bacterium A322]